MSERPSATRPIGVLLADDEPLMRQSLRIVIDSQPDLRVVGETTSGDETVRAARRLTPDVILMDIRMPGSDGISATRIITADPALHTIRVLVLSMYELDEYVYGSLKAGASGFLVKDTHPATLLEAIRRVHDGESLFAPSILAKLIKHYVAAHTHPTQAVAEPPLALLTPRETEVLALVANGLSNKEIIAELRVSGNTVKTHISNLLSKLHARDRAQLVIAAYEHGLVSAGGTQ